MPSPSPAIPCAFEPSAQQPLWDLFCRVIDNHGDLGVALRLSRQLVQAGQRVRLWVDEPSALRWMAPDLVLPPPLLPASESAAADEQPLATTAEHGAGTPDAPMPTTPGAPHAHAPTHTPCITVLNWESAITGGSLQLLTLADVWVELFGCELPQAFVAHGVAQAQATGLRPLWLNLEYLSAEAYVARSHGLPSPIGSGPAQSWTKWFFYPGFTPDTGGLMRSHVAGDGSWAPASARTHLDADADGDGDGDGDGDASVAPDGSGSASLPRLRTTLFCYEPRALPGWLMLMNQAPTLALDWRVMPGRPAAAFQAALQASGAAPGANQDASTDGASRANANASHALPGGPHRVHWLPHMTQAEFDAELAQAELNFVRGEDSLVSALRAGKPLVWHIYPQDDDAHIAKLMAFLRWLGAPPSLVHMHLAWNGVSDEAPPALTPAMLADWQACVSAASRRLQERPDLVAALLDFLAQKQASRAISA